MSKAKKGTNAVETNESELSKKYQKLTQREHVLARPGMYVGSVQSTIEPFDIFNVETEQIERQKIAYSPAFFKILDELIINARDHQVREESVRTIKISFSQEEGWIRVFNDGPGIEVKIHPEHKIYVAELIFGHLLTSSNYDDEEKRVVGGLNGLGAKLCNIYSTKFIVETLDTKVGKKFRQEYRNNMLEKDEPVITKAKTGEASYTEITYHPDFKRFGMSEMTDTDIAWIQKRAYDIAACTRDNVKVYVNDELIKIKNFRDYINLYYPEPPKLVYEEINRRWKVGIVYAPDDGNHHVSFVNAIDTYKGGAHVNYILDQIVDKTIEQIKKKTPFPIKPMMVKQHLDLFVDATIENPDFPSQTKSELTTKVANFGSKCEIPDKMMKELFKTDLIDTIISIATSRAADSLNKTDGKKQSNIDVDKLVDARLAGKGESLNCRLILTEGDSAKKFAVNGLKVIGQDRYGVFPLRGKLLNVRNATLDQIKKNKEISDLKKIMGLQQGVKYNTKEALKKIRYGGILVLTDSDSVTGDTPLLLMGTDKKYCVKTIDDLNNDWVSLPNGKEVCLTNYKVWTEDGWTKIKQVIRHKVQKKIYRVVTHTGVVDVTEDHSLLQDDGTEIAPKDCVVGQALLHSFPQFAENKHKIPNNLDKLPVRELWEYAKLCKFQYYQALGKDKLIDMLNEYKNKITINLDTDNTIDEDEAYVMGLFFADGTCGTYEWEYKHKPINRPNEYTFNRVTYSWAICNTNMDYLNKAIDIMKNNYDYEFKIIEDRSNSVNYGHQMMHRLIINGGKTTKPIVDKYRSLFYDKEAKKKVPLEILNASHKVRENFFEGYYDGDGRKTADGLGKNFDIDGKIGAHGLFFLCKSLGYEVSINTREDKPKIYTLSITKGTQQANPVKIKKMVDLGITEQYVYDLETENHHFQAGVGQMIVHNTDGIHIRGLIINLFQYFWPELLKVDGFIQTLSTPLIKVFKKSDVNKKNPIKFYSENDFDKWAEENDPDKWMIRYYKGLGSSQPNEQIEAFQDYDQRVVSFVWESIYEKTNSQKSSKEENDEDYEDDEDDEDDEDNEDNEDDEDDEDDEDTETINSKNQETKKKKKSKRGKISLVVTDPEIANSKSYDAIRLGFDENRADERKDWLRKHDKNDVLEYTKTTVTYSDFINKDLIHFSNSDVMRSIPSVMDGLKPSQRKVLYVCLKIKNSIKVSQLASKVAEKTAYKHGEVSLEGTIVGMAQYFPGSNNINLLVPEGTFGSRADGGKSHASSRYIFTYLESISEKIFNKHDTCILTNLKEEGEIVEPEFYYPILPMVLVNGASGIGTGFSTNIPQYNPLDICQNLLKRIDGEEMDEMIPWYNGFTGTIEEESSHCYKVFGKYDITGQNTVKITEIPVVGLYSAIDDYEQKVIKPLFSKKEEKATKDKKKETVVTRKKKDVPIILSGYSREVGSEDNEDDVVDFELQFVGNELQSIVKRGGTEFEDIFKLTSKISTKNMHLYDAKGVIKKYDSALDIMEDFYKARLKGYVRRREYHMRELENEIDILKYKVKFIRDKLSKVIILENEKLDKVIEQLVTLKYPKLNASIEAPPEKRTYDYITDMKLFSLTFEKIKELENEYRKKQEEYDDYNSITAEELWKRELNDFIESYHKWLDAKKDRDGCNKNESKKRKKSKTIVKKK